MPFGLESVTNDNYPVSKALDQCDLSQQMDESVSLSCSCPLEMFLYCAVKLVNHLDTLTFLIKTLMIRSVSNGYMS